MGLWKPLAANQRSVSNRGYFCNVHSCANLCDGPHTFWGGVKKLGKISTIVAVIMVAQSTATKNNFGPNMLSGDQIKETPRKTVDKKTVISKRVLKTVSNELLWAFIVFTKITIWDYSQCKVTAFYVLQCHGSFWFCHTGVWWETKLLHMIYGVS